MAGEWNRLTITAEESKIEVVLNGEQIIDADLGEWDRYGKEPRRNGQPLKQADGELPEKGRYIAAGSRHPCLVPKHLISKSSISRGL